MNKLGAILVVLVLAVVAAALSTATAADQSAEEGEGMTEPRKQFLIRLLGTRDGWPLDMTRDEQKIMSEHYLYLKDLTARGTCLMAGPCFEPVFGLVILSCADEAEARAIMEKEPSVAQGVHTYDLNELRVSLRADYKRPDRYNLEPDGRVLHKEVTVSGTIGDVWKAWTTSEGLEAVFAPAAIVELRPGGPFEIYFDQSAPYGSRGSEDCHILSYIPHRMLSFEWNAPPSFGELRGVHTWVVVLFEETGDGEVQIDFSHYGWGTGEQWDGVYDYFDKAWTYVLGEYEKHFAGK